MARTLEQEAVEYAKAGKVSGTEAIRKRAFLAGARAALEMASDKANEMQAAAARVLAKKHNADAGVQHDTAKEIYEAIRSLLPSP